MARRARKPEADDEVEAMANATTADAEGAEDNAAEQAEIAAKLEAAKVRILEAAEALGSAEEKTTETMRGAWNEYGAALLLGRDACGGAKQKFGAWIESNALDMAHGRKIHRNERSAIMSFLELPKEAQEWITRNHPNVASPKYLMTKYNDGLKTAVEFTLDDIPLDSVPGADALKLSAKDTAEQSEEKTVKAQGYVTQVRDVLGSFIESNKDADTSEMSDDERAQLAQDLIDAESALELLDAAAPEDAAPIMARAARSLAGREPPFKEKEVEDAAKFVMQLIGKYPTEKQGDLMSAVRNLIDEYFEQESEEDDDAAEDDDDIVEDESIAAE